MSQTIESGRSDTHVGGEPGGSPPPISKPPWTIGGAVPVSRGWWEMN